MSAWCENTHLIRQILKHLSWFYHLCAVNLLNLLRTKFVWAQDETSRNRVSTLCLCVFVFFSVFVFVFVSTSSFFIRDVENPYLHSAVFLRGFSCFLSISLSQWRDREQVEFLKRVIHPCQLLLMYSSFSTGSFVRRTTRIDTTTPTTTTTTWRRTCTCMDPVGGWLRLEKIRIEIKWPMILKYWTRDMHVSFKNPVSLMR